MVIKKVKFNFRADANGVVEDAGEKEVIG